MGGIDWAGLAAKAASALIQEGLARHEDEAAVRARILATLQPSPPDLATEFHELAEQADKLGIGRKD